MNIKRNDKYRSSLNSMYTNFLSVTHPQKATNNFSEKFMRTKILLDNCLPRILFHFLDSNLIRFTLKPF